MKVFLVCLLALAAFCDARPPQGDVSEDDVREFASAMAKELGVDVSEDDVVKAFKMMRGEEKKKRTLDEKMQYMADLVGEDKETLEKMAEDLEKALGVEFDEDRVNQFLEENGERLEKEFLEATMGMSDEELEKLKGDVVAKVEEMLKKPRMVKMILKELSDEGLIKPADRPADADLTKGDNSAGMRGGMGDISEDDVRAAVEKMGKELGVELSEDDVVGMLEKMGDKMGVNMAKRHMGKGGEGVKDILNDIDDEDIRNLAGAVSNELGMTVTEQDVKDFLSENGKMVEEVALRAAAELNDAELSEFEDLLNHPNLLGNVLGKLEDMGALE